MAGVKTGASTKPCTFSIYWRQLDKINELKEANLFSSKSSIVRQALDFFFLFPFIKEMAIKDLKKELENEHKQQLVEKYYNDKIIRVLDGKEL